MRITRKDVERVFPRFCEALGLRVAADYRDKGAYSLDYIRCYGGYVIVRYLETGGETCDFGDMRRSAREMYEAMHFAIKAVETAQRRGTKC